MDVTNRDGGPGVTPAAGTPVPAEHRSVFTGEEFAQHVADPDRPPIADREVLGPVQLRGRKLEHMIEIRNVVFTHPVNFSNSTFERGLDLRGCRFMQGLVLANACVEGPLILDEAVLGMETEVPPDVLMLERSANRLARRRSELRASRDATREERIRKLRMRLRARRKVREWRARIAREKARVRPAPQTMAEFTNLRVGGALSLVDAHVYGAISCPHADIEDDFRIDGSRILGGIVLRRSSLGEFRTEGCVLSPAGTPVDGVRNGCFVGGDLNLTSTHVAGDLRLIGAAVRGQVSLQAAEVDGNVLCRPGYGHRTTIGKDAWFLGLRVKGKLVVTGVRINGDLNLNVAEIGGSLDGWPSGWVLDVGGSLYASNSRIGAAVELARARVREIVALNGARVGGGVTLSGADLRQSVQLQGAVVGGTVFCRVTEGLNPEETCRVGGHLWLLGAEIGADLDLSGAEIKGELVLQNAKVGQNLLAKFMSGYRTHVHGTATLTGVKVVGSVRWTGATLDDALFLDAASIGADVSFEAAREGERVSRCTVAKKLHLYGATVGGSVSIGGTEIGTHLEMQSATVGHHVDLCTSEGLPTVVKRGADLEGVQVSGNLVVAGATVTDALVLERASIGGNLKVVFDLVRTPAWHVERTHVGSLQAESASVGKDLVLVGTVVGPLADTAADWRRGVDFAGIQVGGKLQMHRPGEGKDNLHAQKTDAESWEFSPEDERELIASAGLERVEVHGDLKLARAEVTGDLVLDGVEIHGSLDLRNARVGANLSCRPRRMRPAGSAPTARRADLQTLEVTGDADLTGMTISEDLILRDSRIRGRLELKRQDAEARVGGIVDLDAAEIAHAVLSGANVPPSPDIAPAAKNARRRLPLVLRLKTRAMRVLRGGEPEDCDGGRPASGILVLERASIRKLDIRPPLPAELYISDLKVASWEESARYFREVLERTRPFRKSCYLTVESELRNKGRDAAADNVHVWMRRRDRRNTKGFWPVLWDRFLDVTTEYGTTSRRLFWVMLLWFGATVFIFLDHEHVRYHITPTALHVPPPVREVPASRWDTADAVFMAVRLHVPIVSLGIDEPVQPRQTWVQIWALVAIAASWLMWPLFIASASGYLRRKT